jgi:hypothetical protein
LKHDDLPRQAPDKHNDKTRLKERFPKQGGAVSAGIIAPKEQTHSSVSSRLCVCGSSSSKAARMSAKHVAPPPSAGACQQMSLFFNFPLRLVLSQSGQMMLVFIVLHKKSA